MNVSVIYGTTNKTSTYNCVQLLLGELRLNIDIEVTEFFLKQNLSYLSVGYSSCVENNVQACPSLNNFNYITDSFYKSDLVILACPVSQCDISTEMQTILDDLSYHYAHNNINYVMHDKIGLVVSTTAGAGLFRATRTMKKNLNSWGIDNTFKFSGTLYEIDWEDIDLKTRLRIRKKIFRLSCKILNLYNNLQSINLSINSNSTYSEIKPALINNYTNVIDFNQWKMQACLDNHNRDV